MKKILFLTTSSNNVFTVIDSLRYLGDQYEVRVFHYDAEWNKVCHDAIQSNPNVRQELSMGLWPRPENREGIRTRVSLDSQMITLVSEWKPDVVLYISAWEGLFVPKNETLRSIRAESSLVHLCFDGADPPWWPQMLQFEKEQVFDLTVTIDGAHYWPGGKRWDRDWRIKGVSLLTPVDPRYFQGVQVPFNVRPYDIGYAGNAGGWVRGHLVSQMQKHKSDIFTYRQRDDHPQSYRMFCDFLRHCKVVISVPFTGSNATTHVKGRPVEAGWAGAALLEWENPATEAWFIPRYDYEYYNSIPECLEMASWLAAHPKRSEELAAALHEEVVMSHSPEKFWTKVFENIPARNITEH